MVARARSAARATALVAMFGALAAAIALACGTGDISDLTAGHPDSGVTIDAGIDAPVEAAVCMHASPPARPTNDDAVNLPDIVFAFSDVRFDTGDEDAGLPKPVGLDLDQTCTCLEPDSCKPPDAGGMPRMCDGPNGVDNVAGPLLADVVALGMGLGPDVASKQIKDGSFSILVLVQGWNGLPDDPSVVVGVATSNGVEGSQGDAASQPPKFDGNDVWTVTPNSIIDGADLDGRDCRTIPIASCLPSQADTHAYVRNNVLVAHLDVPLPILTKTGFFPIDFKSATISGKITKSADGAYHLDGEMDGRWPVDTLLPTFARIHNPLTDVALCASDAGMDIYNMVKETVCESVDLAASPTLDHTGAPCQSLSNAVRFSAVKATIGTVYQSTSAIANDCPSFTDSCPKP